MHGIQFIRYISNTTRLPVLTFFTKMGHCPLCDEARTVLRKHMNKFRYEEVYIDIPENSTWHKLYRYDIPVIHINGEFAMKHRVVEDELLDVLNKTKKMYY